MNRLFDENNMNIHEGHLGGYIKSSNQPSVSGLNIKNGDPMTWHPDLWLWAMSALNIKSVLDIGCGEGHCAAFFKKFGCDVTGVDGSRLAYQDSKIPNEHVQHDFCTGSFKPNKRYDMVWCSEFVEHVEERYADNFLETFKYANNFILMTFAQPDQLGWHHVNCQSQAYWEDKLCSIGYMIEPQLTRISREISTGHFAHSGLVFCKQ